jgi:hypothetical protein
LESVPVFALLAMMGVLAVLTAYVFARRSSVARLRYSVAT